MPVNLRQYKGVVVAFKSRVIYLKQDNIFQEFSQSGDIKKDIIKEAFTIFTSF